MSDEYGYPTEEEIARIKGWKFPADGTFEQFMDYVKSVGHYWPADTFGWSHEGREYEVSTGGWSGNEEIIAAMQDNFLFWAMCWRQSRRGGHHTFTIPEITKVQP